MLLLSLFLRLPELSELDFRLAPESPRDPPEPFLREGSSDPLRLYFEPRPLALLEPSCALKTSSSSSPLISSMLALRIKSETPLGPLPSSAIKKEKN